MDKNLKLMLVAGEDSGDAHAARLVKAIRDEAGADVDLFGCAGPRMRGVGVEPVVNADELAIIGLPEIARALPMFLRTFRRLRDAAIERRPDGVILVDFPEFNLKLARSLHRAGLKVIYYISPQLWGWRGYRKKTIQTDVDLLLTILPFEKQWYAERGILNVEYVGNPLVNEVAATETKEQTRERYDIGGSDTLIALLPGSRKKEVARILPRMLDAADLISATRPDVRFIAAATNERRASQIREIIEGRHGTLPVEIATNDTYNVVAASDAAAVTSGTATLETGLLLTPLVVVYAASSLNYRLIRPFVSSPHFGLINLIAEKRIAEELIQDDLTPEALASELVRLLEPDTNNKARNELREASAKLGPGGASERAAKLIIDLIKRRG